MSLIIACVFFFSGFLILCDCPSWYAIAAGFAGISAWAGRGRTRKWAIVCLVASLIVAGMEALGEAQERHRYMEREKIDTLRIPGTNSAESTNSTRP
jgi:hypothetical protein